MNVVHRWPLRTLGVALATSLLQAPVEAQPEASNCDAVAGVFLVAGELRDDDGHSQPVAYLERVGTEDDRRHHFQYAFNSKRGAAEIVMFNATGERLFDTVGTSYTCKGGVLVRESEIGGASEGCSREGVSRSALTIGSTGSLIFTTEERIAYGFWCFKSPTHTRRIAEFLPYRGEAK